MEKTKELNKLWSEYDCLTGELKSKKLSNPEHNKISNRLTEIQKSIENRSYG